MGNYIVGSAITSMGHHGAMLAALEWVLRYISDGWLVANVLKQKRVYNFLHKALPKCFFQKIAPQKISNTEIVPYLHFQTPMKVFPDPRH